MTNKLSLSKRLKCHAEYLDTEGCEGSFSRDLLEASRLLDRGPFAGEVDPRRVISIILGGGTVAQYSTAVAIVDGLRASGLLIVQQTPGA